MNNIRLCAPCLFGLESVLSGEVKRLGFSDINVSDGRVEFSSDLSGIAVANLFLRTAERVLIVLSKFEATTFQELIDKSEDIPFENYIDKHDAFPVKGVSLNSILQSVPTCQSIIKKAAVNRLSKVYHINWFEEMGPKVQIQFMIFKNQVSVMLDTSGEGLHKRGYRQHANAAPIKETLAAGILDIARIYPDTIIMDPFCGSGTFLIEAALKAKNIAPGIKRRFLAEKWGSIDDKIWKEGRQQALDSIRKQTSFQGIGSDIDSETLEIATKNAHYAGIGKMIKFSEIDVKDFSPMNEKSIIVTNPPYGERLLDASEASRICQTMGKVFIDNGFTNYYIISSNESFEDDYGQKASKTRKLYNGNLKCNLFQYIYR